MTTAEVERLLAGLEGVRLRGPEGERVWRVQGRLVARQLDATHLVVRSTLDARDLLLRDHPGTFEVPPRFAAHQMVVADLEHGDSGAVEEALHAAWVLQRR